MANRERGEVALEAGGETYVLRFSINALCELEDAVGAGLPEILAKFDTGEMDIRTGRALLWAALRDNHSDLSQNDVGNIAWPGGITGALEAAGKALTAAFPDAKGGAGKKPKGRVGSG